MRNIEFNNVYINNYFTLISSKANNPTIINDVDLSIEDYYLNKKTFEEGEAEYQTLVTRGLLEKENKKPNDIDLMVGGDLQNQLFASNYNASKYEIPFLGVFSACASFIEGIIIGASLIGKNKLRNTMVVTSSNNLVSEKQFRFPVEYGALRKKVNSFSSSGAVSAIISNKKSNIMVESATIGRVIDMGHTDTNDMGACMAPAVAETLYDHLTLTGRSINYYDVILTGDLGVYGLEYFKEYLNKKH
jgi:stage V sporulation protein AD